METEFQKLQTQVQDLLRKLGDLTTDFENHRHADARGYPINLVNINGFVPTILDASGATANRDKKIVNRPTNFYDQMFYWTDVPGGGTAKRLYFFDSTNTSPTYSNGWHFVTMT